MSWVKDIRLQKNDFSLNIPQWEVLDEGVTAVVGPSGAGKSTLFRVLLGLESCNFSWKWQDIDLAKLSAPDRRLGVVFQSLDLFPHMTAKENILFAAEARGLKSQEANTRLKQLTDCLGMSSFINRSVQEISGGERQRVALSRAIVARPRVLLLDEPFSALDISLRQEAREMVKNFLKQENVPAILVTHDEADVQALAHKVTRLEGGQIILDQPI